MPPPVHKGHGGGSQATRARKRRHGAGHGEEEGGNERWLVTYADMLTLLLVLFIVLFSISVVNTSKFIALKTSLGAAFGNGTTGILSGGQGLTDNSASGTGQQLVMPGMPIGPATGAQPNTTPGGPATGAQTGASVAPVPDKAKVSSSTYTKADVAREVDKFRAIEAAISKALKQHGMNGAVRFSINERGLVITVITNALVFPGNSATLLAEGRDILSAIAPPLAGEVRNIEVDGNTNQEKVSTAPYPSGWELSSARASAVVRYLSANGVAQSRLAAVGYSDQHPLYPASDPRSVTLNRRVEIVVLSALPASAGSDLQTAGH